MSARCSRDGQALTELAVFGSLMLLLFGYLLNTALSDDYRQQAEMEAFRRALASAAGSTVEGQPISTSHLLIQDRHIPNPSDPFAIGAATAVSAQGGVTRNHELHVVASEEADLPRLNIHIEHSDCLDEPCSYTLSGFRMEPGVSSTSLERYRVIYGAQNVCEKFACGGNPGGQCIEWEDGIDEHDQEKRVCSRYADMTLRIVDPCEGQIISRDACTQQAAQIVNSQACEAECQKAYRRSCEEECKDKESKSKACKDCNDTQNRTTSKCKEICSQVMNVPEYALDLTPAVGLPARGERWVAPRIERMFTGIENMGVQPGSTQTVDTDHALNKQESPEAIVSTTTIGLTETTTRDIVTRGSPTRQVTATREEGSTTTWTAPW